MTTNIYIINLINRNNQIFHEFKKQTKIDLSTSSSVRLEQIQLFAY